jgi:5-methylcytosine-specific restriction endonuclease McrA
MTWRTKRSKELPADWPQRRARRLWLDAYRCTECGKVGTDRNPLEVHHARGRDDHNVTSLRTLCRECHKRATVAENQAARGVGALRRRPKPPHPGLRT